MTMLSAEQGFERHDNARYEVVNVTSAERQSLDQVVISNETLDDNVPKLMSGVPQDADEVVLSNDTVDEQNSNITGQSPNVTSRASGNADQVISSGNAMHGRCMKKSYN
ncbi:hypothetical protein KIN20_035100 [Parelaphostrongylus tenuis]|uniref:Uncharacterized protein n=1 Tax=Parelaphostrongylus tenuis TaxID=148309 RepID=A0AAD5RB96_PARTN|nr:hypothetical protein KIN20_035100 [Parelaphostrongylus tenuis]